MTVIKFKTEHELPKRQRIRIAVAIDDEGNWVAAGSSDAEESKSTIDDLIGIDLSDLNGDAQQQYWLVVDVPLPPTEVLAGQTVDEE